MSIPSLPALRSNSWYGWAQAIHGAVLGSSLPQFHGARYVAYGHSFGQVLDPPNVWPNSVYPARLRDLLHADPALYANRTVSGSIMWQITAHLEETWVAGDYGLVSVMGAQNDIGSGHADPNGLTNYKNALREFLTTLQTGAHPPTVLVIKATTSTTAGYALYTPPPTDADVATYNTATDQVVAEFPNNGSIVVADPLADGWNPATMTCPDGLHPNDQGMAHIAASCIKALAQAPYRAGLNYGMAAAAAGPTGPTMTTLRGTPTYGAGKFGNALTAGVLGATSSSFATAVGTVEGWVRTTATDLRVAIGDGVLWLGMTPGGVPTIGLPGGTASGSTPINNGAWHHLAYTGDGTTGRLWVDGAQVASGAFGQSFGWGENSRTVAIGGFGADASFDWSGSIDEVRWSNVVRYTATFTPPTGPFTADANTVALYHLES